MKRSPAVISKDGAGHGLATDGIQFDSGYDEIGCGRLLRIYPGVRDSQFVSVSLWCLLGVFQGANRTKRQ